MLLNIMAVKDNNMGFYYKKNIGKGYKMNSPMAMNEDKNTVIKTGVKELIKGGLKKYAGKAVAGIFGTIGTLLTTTPAYGGQPKFDFPTVELPEDGDDALFGRNPDGTAITFEEFEANQNNQTKVPTRFNM